MLFQKKSIDVPQSKVLLEDLTEKYRLAEEARAGLEARLTNLLEFIRIMAHNLGGPVGNMAQLVEIIPQLPPGEELDEYMSMLPPTLSSMQTALDELRMVIEIQSKAKIAYDDCKLDEVLDIVKRRLHYATTERHGFIATSLQEKVIRYPITYLENILYTLIEYCLSQAKPDISPSILVSTGREANRVFLKVESNSTSLDVDKESGQLFKYKKSSYATQAGEGMGLFLVKNQVETLGGQVFVSSRAGQGILLTVLF